MNCDFLILGGTGQVGFELLYSLKKHGDVIAPNRNELELSNLAKVSEFIDRCNPKIIINAAAWTAVDKAEEQPVSAFLINCELPKLLANYAKQKNVWLIHYSSDYVFSGEGTIPFSELDIPAPISIYGKSKLAGDKAILDSCSNFLIFRTSWVYSYRGHNFLKTMLQLGKKNQFISVVSDQIGSPTSAKSIADMTTLVINKIKSGDIVHSGVYNLTTKGYVSWFEYTQKIFSIARDLKWDLSVKSLVPISSTEFKTLAKRPLNSRLNNYKFERAFDAQMPSWESDLYNTMLKITENMDMK